MASPLANVPGHQVALQRLQSAVESSLQERALSDQQRQQVLDAAARIARQLQQALQIRAAQTRTQVTPASYLLQSPEYRPLSPAPMDAELQQLEEQVNEAAQRAAVLRQTAPNQLKEIYAQKLRQLAPSADAALPGCDDKDAAAAAGAASMEAEDGAGSGVEGLGEENAGEGRDGPLTYSPDPQRLREQLADAGSKLPVLRARLAEAGDRVQRVAAVLSTELSRPPPNTVERAVLGKTPRRPAEAGGRALEASPAFKQALESGMVSTWRGRLSKDVQPVPLALPEEEGEEEQGEPGQGQA